MKEGRKELVLFDGNINIVYAKKVCRQTPVKAQTVPLLWDLILNAY